MTDEQDTAKKIVARLDPGLSGMDAATVGRLAAARARAVAAVARPATHVEILHGGVLRQITAHLHGRHAWIASAALLAAVLLALLMLQNGLLHPPVETDTLLLASDLPPEAYVDKGFHAWLEGSSQL